MTVREQARGPMALTPPAVDYPQDGSVRPTGRHVWEPVETAPLPPGFATELRGRSIAVLGGRPETAAEVATALTGAAATVHRLAPPEPAAAGGIGGAVAAFRAAVGRIDGIVDLNVEEPLDLTGEDGWESALHQTVALLQSCYDDWSAETDATRLFYLAVTRLGGRMGFGPGTVPQPLGGLWAGLAKGLPREVPNCNIKVVDLAQEGGAGTAELVRRELYRWGAFEVGHQDGRRYTLRARPVAVDRPRVSIRPGDAVVMSGGGRGIGFALARALAENFGARVIVSGRGAPPLVDDGGAGGDAAGGSGGGEASPVAMSEAAFRRYRDERLRRAARDRRLPEVRAELERLGQDRELWANLVAAREAGLRIDYVQCDIADPAQARRLLDAAGDRLVGIVHDAGVDVPVRLPGKTPQVVTAVVRVKVAGFFHLLREAEDRQGLAFFCSVGSLTGRWGGMVGQLDYGAANEALSRLGLWAAQSSPQPGRRRRVPVTTVCWPTWERLGMITNYEATLRYMSAVDVREGLYHWQRELLSDAGGEVTFIGDVGQAMLPSVLRGYQQDSGLPGIGRLASSRFYLGVPLRFRPRQALSTAHVLRAEEMPCCDDFLVGGEPALPVSLCLEFLRAGGAWALPEGGDRLRPGELRDVSVDLRGLRAGPGRRTVELLRNTEGRWSDDGSWLITTTLERDGRQLARMELVHSAEPARPGESVDRVRPAGPPPAAVEPVPPPAHDALRWSGHVFRLTSWQRDPLTGRREGTAERERMSDLLLASPPPGAALPLNCLENVLRAAWGVQSALGGRGAGAGRLTVRALRLGSSAVDGAVRLVGDPDGLDWSGHDDRGRHRLSVSGVRFH